jgi:hypothetical protein
MKITRPPDKAALHRLDDGEHGIDEYSDISSR